MSETKAIFIQYGCGFAAGHDWENFDASPTLRIERVPLIGRFLSARFSGNVRRFPDNVRYGDIVAGLPIADGTAQACYASHVLEHLSLEDCRKALVNTFRMLAPGGTFRLVVPDLLVRAELYVERARRGSPDASAAFLRESLLGRERRPKTLLQMMRSIIGDPGHLWMWDEAAMRTELERAGFTAIRRHRFGDADEPRFAQIEDIDRFINPVSGLQELALEARKPA